MLCAVGSRGQRMLQRQSCHDDGEQSMRDSPILVANEGPRPDRGSADNDNQTHQGEDARPKTVARNHAGQSVPGRNRINQQGIEGVAQGMHESEGQQHIGGNPVELHGSVDADPSRKAFVPAGTQKLQEEKRGARKAECSAKLT